MNKTYLQLATLLIVPLSALAAEKFDWNKLDLSKLPPPSERTGLTYTNDIRTILESSCLRCHGEQSPKGGLRLGSLDALLKGGNDGKVVVAGDSQKSPLVVAVAQLDDDTAMPPKRGPGRGEPNGPAGGGEFGGRGEPPRGGPGWPGAGFGPPPKSLSAEQVGLIRAWIDQGQNSHIPQPVLVSLSLASRSEDS